MQIVRRETREITETFPIRKYDVAPTAFDQAGGVERFQHPIDMDCGQSRRLPDLLLRHRQFIAGVGATLASIAADRVLAQKVRDAPQSVSAANIDEPLAGDRMVDGLMNTESMGDRRAAGGKLLYRWQRHHGDIYRRQRAHIMIAGLQVKMLEADSVTSDG